MELSGVHVKRHVRITYRFTTFKKDEPDATVEGVLGKITHKPGGEVYIYGAYGSGRALNWSRGVSTNFRIPFDAVVEFLDDDN